MSKVLCFYHRKDWDGLASGAIVKRRYPEAELIGYDYTDNWLTQEWVAGKVTKDTVVFMVDVCAPWDVMIKILQRAASFTWIDHHITSIQAAPAIFMNGANVACQVGKAACFLTWSYMFPGLQVPPCIELLAKYDIWDNKDADFWERWILPFQFGMRQIPLAIEAVPEWVFLPVQLASGIFIKEFEETMLAGRAILTYQEQQNVGAMKSAFSATLYLPRAVNGSRMYTALCCNGGAHNSLTFKSRYTPEQFELMLSFHFNGDRWKATIFTERQNVNCGEIAKALGGGGHQKAAGFVVEDIFKYLVL